MTLRRAYVPDDDGNWGWQTIDDPDGGDENGGSLPEQWTVDENGSLTINSGGEAYIDLWNAAGSGGFIAGSEFGTIIAPSDPDSTPLGVSAPAGQTARIFTVGDQVALYLQVQKDGSVIISKVAAPADAILLAGDMAIWFDQTDGAAKLKIKAKTADGTVVVGELALAP